MDKRTDKSMARVHLSRGVCVLCCLLLMTLGDVMTSSSSPGELECCPGCVHNTYYIQSKTETLCINRSKKTSHYAPCGSFGWSKCSHYSIIYSTVCEDHTKYYISHHAICNQDCSCVDQP